VDNVSGVVDQTTAVTIKQNVATGPGARPQLRRDFSDGFHGT